MGLEMLSRTWMRPGTRGVFGVPGKVEMRGRHSMHRRRQGTFWSFRDVLDADGQERSGPRMRSDRRRAGENRTGGEAVPPVLARVVGIGNRAWPLSRVSHLGEAVGTSKRSPAPRRSARSGARWIGRFPFPYAPGVARAKVMARNGRLCPGRPRGFAPLAWCRRVANPGGDRGWPRGIGGWGGEEVGELGWRIRNIDVDAVGDGMCDEARRTGSGVGWRCSRGLAVPSIGTSWLYSVSSDLDAGRSFPRWGLKGDVVDHRCEGLMRLISR